MLVREIPDNAQFVDNNPEVASILESLGLPPDDYDTLFVIVGDGDYDAVWGMEGCVPYLTRHVDKLR